MDTQQISDRVHRGARELDRVFGPDWDLRIDTEILNINSSVFCVCGQLSPDGWLLTLHRLQLSTADADDFGFSPATYNELEAINEAWRFLIVHRRKERVDREIAARKTAKRLLARVA